MFMYLWLLSFFLPMTYNGGQNCWYLGYLCFLCRLDTNHYGCHCMLLQNRTVISESGKPLIGHNCFLDLVKLFHQFFNHLPVKYKDFKKQIHHLFPIIFDTKNICLNVQKKISKVHPELEHVFTSSNLNELHETLGTLFIIHFIKNKIRSTHIMYLSTFFYCFQV